MGNIAKNENKVAFSMKMNSNGFQKTILNTLQDPARAARFTASITSAVSNQPEIQKCTAETILSAALLGESLNLSPSPQLGQFYIVPYRDNKNNRDVATFQLGYKGYVQLALRSGNYKKLNVLEIKDGEFVSWNPLTEELIINPIEDVIERELKETIGYCANFEYLNGFTKTIYWTKNQMEAHAQKYSKAYQSDKRNGRKNNLWSTQFDEMAKKTMLRQIISKWGIMSTEMQEAYVKDNSVITDNDTPEYIDNQEDLISEAAEAIDVTEIETESKNEEFKL